MCFDCQEIIRRFEAIEECREEFSYMSTIAKKCYHHPGALPDCVLRVNYPEIMARRSVINLFGVFLFSRISPTLFSTFELVLTAPCLK